MANYVLLNNVDHHNLKVVTRYGAENGGNANSVMTFPTEYADVAREYPILFRKDAQQQTFHSYALLGFDKTENLFLMPDGGWNASYVPGYIARGPFLIGYQEQEVNGEVTRAPVIHIDLDDTRVNETEGQPLFLEQGGNSPYLERVATVLRGIGEGLSVNNAMFTAFEQCDLIEPVNVNVEIHQDLKYNLTGFYTISETKLANLSGEALEKLNRAGFLQAAFLVVCSLRNMKKLIEMKRKSIAQHTA